MLLLEVNKLTVFYNREKTPAVEEFSFKLYTGEIVCIVGESGSGKSTVLKAIAGLLPKHAKVYGEIRFKGINLLKLEEDKLNNYRGKDIGLIFQEPSIYLDPLYKVGEQIEETCKIHIGKNCYQRAIESLFQAGISNAEKVYHLYPHQLSGGLKQRVNIADATVNNPLLLLADEPTTALDVSTQKRILNLIKKLKYSGKSILLVTHDLGVVWEVADRVLVMKDGKKVEEGTVTDIYLNPKNSYTKELLKIFKELSIF